VQSRVVRFLPDGTITPAGREDGWSLENTSCIDDVVVEITSDNTSSASPALDTFANIGLRSLLEQQLAMDCKTVNIRSDMTTTQGGTRLRRNKSINTCATSTGTGNQQVSEGGTATASDVRNLCPRNVSDSRVLLGIASGGAYRSVYNGIANLERSVASVTISGTGAAGREGQRNRWVGTAINCSGSDDFTVSCGNIPNAPGGLDKTQPDNKWNSENIDVDADNWDWWNEVFDVCFGVFSDCVYVDSAGAYTLNWDYFNKKWTMHSGPQTTRAHRSLSATDWIDPYTNFTPSWNLPADGTQAWGVVENYCLMRRKEIQLECPLYYDPGKQAGWYPYELNPETDFHTTLIPGGSYRTAGDLHYVSGNIYYQLMGEGKTVGLSWVNGRNCDLKGCDHWTTYAGPGTDAYIKSWTYGDDGSIGQGSVSVQTIMMNRDGQQIDYTPRVVSGPKLQYVGQYSIPLHCGRIERRSFSWPGYTLATACGGKSCWSYWAYSPVTIREVVTREWSGDNQYTGTWSYPNVVYKSDYGTWGSVSQIPNPLYHSRR
jgi:hypothetical protein